MKSFSWLLCLLALLFVVEAQTNGPETVEEEEAEDLVWEGINEELSCYRTVVETYASMDGFVDQYPGLVTVESMGQSYLKQQNENEGYNIPVMVIGANTTNVEKVDMMIIGGAHSRELPPPEVLMRWAEYLLTSYGIDPDITWILNRTRIHIVPISNPDGRQIVQDRLDWYYRKNARPVDCDEGPEEYGVDLNRNYPMFYGDDIGSSSDPCDSDYRGTGPLSEPETLAVFQYASKIFDDSIKKGTPSEAIELHEVACPVNATGIFMDVHSSGNEVYFPWGYKDRLSPDHLPLLTMAAKLASPGNYKLWGPDQESFDYRTSGDAVDAAYGINCVFGQGYEIGSEKYASCNELETIIVPIMQESLLYAAKCVSAPYLLPLGPDILSIDVNRTDPENVTLVVSVSDEALIVEHANFRANRSQPIAKVQVFVDDHPYDAASEGIPMEPEDGAFDDVDEVATLKLDLTHLEEGLHTLYLQATDAHGYVGPASAIYIELEGASTNHSGLPLTENQTATVSQTSIHHDG